MSLRRPTLTFDTADPAFVREPRPRYEEIRHLGGVIYNEQVSRWMVSDFDVVKHILTSPERFGSEHGQVRELSNWGRWGPDDQIGTLNLITAQLIQAAVAEVGCGKVFQLSIPVGGDAANRTRVSSSRIMLGANSMVRWRPSTRYPRWWMRLGDRATVLLDSGVRTRTDVVTALAQGADAVMIGRPYIYGLAVAAGDGVHPVLDILAPEMRRTLLLMGVGSVRELSREHVLQ
jgi:FMN-dependent dehydrogenase